MTISSISKNDKPSSYLLIVNIKEIPISNKTVEFLVEVFGNTDALEKFLSSDKHSYYFGPYSLEIIETYAFKVSSTASKRGVKIGMTIKNYSEKDNT